MNHDPSDALIAALIAAVTELGGPRELHVATLATITTEAAAVPIAATFAAEASAEYDLVREPSAEELEALAVAA